MTKNQRFDLTDKICVITGGAGLIGQAFVQACVSQGAKVIIADIDQKTGAQLANKITQQRAEFIKCDITNLSDISNLLRLVTKKHKKIDALVNNAYPRNKKYGRLFEDVTYDDFCENVNLHLGGYFLMTQQTAKIMKKQKHGIIINMASIYGFHAPDFSLYDETAMTVPVEYAAIKGAIINLTKYWAKYLAPYQIRVNAISPGGVFNDQSAAFVEKYKKRVPLQNRMAKTDDLVGTLIYLLSDASQYVTGQNIVVDGGWTL